VLDGAALCAGVSVDGVARGGEVRATALNAEGAKVNAKVAEEDIGYAGMAGSSILARW